MVTAVDVHAAGRSVIVGTDGSDSAMAAVIAAAGEASTRRLPLRIVHVVDIGTVCGVPGLGYRPGTLHEAAALLAAAADLARPTLGADDPAVELVYGDPVGELVARSAGADLIVLGRGRRGIGRWRPGSVANQVALTAHCPVALISVPYARSMNAAPPEPARP